MQGTYLQVCWSDSHTLDQSWTFRYSDFHLSHHSPSCSHSLFPHPSSPSLVRRPSSLIPRPSDLNLYPRALRSQTSPLSLIPLILSASVQFPLPLPRPDRPDAETPGPTTQLNRSRRLPIFVSLGLCFRASLRVYILGPPPRSPVYIYPPDFHDLLLPVPRPHALVPLGPLGFHGYLCSTSCGLAILSLQVGTADTRSPTSPRSSWSNSNRSSLKQ